MAPFLSVLTPNFNYSHFLADALQSVSHQSDKHLIQQIVIDGGSSDGSLELLSEWSSRIDWISEPDEGQSDALNKGLDLATGEWVSWLNSDEFYLPGLMSFLTDALAECPSADVVYGDVVFVDREGQFMRLKAEHSFSRRILRGYGCYIASCAAFFRRDLLIKAGWDRELTAIMDWDLYLSLADLGANVWYRSSPVGAFRVHESQRTVDQVSVPQTSPEHLRVRRRHNMLVRPLPIAMSAAASRVERRLRKIANGSYARERRAKRMRGQDLRWFADLSKQDAFNELKHLYKHS